MNDVRANGIAHFGSVEAYETFLAEQREANERYMAKVRAERAEVERKVEAERQAKLDAANATELERVKAQARAAFPGSAAEFERAWGGIKEAWQQRQALNAIGDMDVLIARKKASGLY